MFERVLGIVDFRESPPSQADIQATRDLILAVVNCLTRCFYLCDDNFQNHRLAFRDQLPLIAWQLGE